MGLGPGAIRGCEVKLTKSTEPPSMGMVSQSIVEPPKRGRARSADVLRKRAVLRFSVF